MKKIIVSLSLLLSFTLLSSCSDLMDLESDGRVEIKDIFSTYNRTTEYLNSCYNFITSPGFTYDGMNTALASFSDEAHDANDNKDGDVTGWYNGWTSSSYNPLASSYYDPWAHYFAGIRKCNSFLIYISDPEITTYPFEEALKEGWIAQIRVLRSFFYLQLIKRYGGVPIMSTPYEDDHDYTQDKRATFEECVDFIIAECDAALQVPLPPAAASDRGFRWDRTNEGMRKHMTRGIAHAVMSQAALYAASELWTTDSSGNPITTKYTWAKVTEITKKALDECLANGFALYSEDPRPEDAQNAYAYYFFNRSDVTRGWDKETIYDPSVFRTNVWKWAGLPITPNMEKAGACPTQELIDSYETIDGEPILDLAQPYLDAKHLQLNYNGANATYDPQDPYANRDPRFYASVFYNGASKRLDDPSRIIVETFVGGNCEISLKVTETRYTRTGYYIRKFNNWRSDINNDSDGLIRVFRLAELYLNFAEAANNSVGPDVQVSSTSGGSAMSAKEAVDVVRARAGMPDIPAGLSKDQFELRYRNERRVEFAFEEHRFYDVRRWKILSETDRYITAMQITKGASDELTYKRISLKERPTFTNKYLLYPIRQNEVNKMNVHTGENWQNPGWY